MSYVSLCLILSSHLIAIKIITMTERIKIKELRVLSDNWYILRKATFDFLRKDGRWQTQERECYDRGNGATILLYNKAQKTVILVRQFRMPTFLNGNTEGLLIETPAGLLDALNPEECIKKEVEEETGYKVTHVKKIFAAYMSPGAVTEMLHFFVAEYAAHQKINEGGGLEHEQEEIEVIEMPFSDAVQMIETGEIRDGKTIMLLQYAAVNHLFE
jgi:GDP-mannose pyrophosphatase NudK